MVDDIPLQAESQAITRPVPTLFTVPFINKPITLTSIKYLTFFLCGVANLWPWNCFLSASEYFQDSFKSSPSLANNYSSTMMTISTITSTIFNYILSQRQKGADYEARLMIGNSIQVGIFILMALTVFIPKSALLYFVFVMCCVMASSIGACLAQVGVLALVNVEGAIFANANVVGNAVAGVLPSISLIFAILINGGTKHVDEVVENGNRNREAVNYFLVSACVASFALLSLYYMQRSEDKLYYQQISTTEESESEPATFDVEEESQESEQAHIPFSHLWSILKLVQTSIFLTFSLTLIFPVYASSVESVGKMDKKLYIPLAFLVWNAGDLAGRILCAFPRCVIKNQILMVLYSCSRIIFVPFLMGCNIKNRGGFIGDFGYMVLQFLFGLTNGQIFSSCFMLIGELLTNEDEKKAAAGFTAFLVNLSLLFGSLLSYLFAYWIS